MKFIIFDMDGTLVDSMYVWQQVDREYIAKYNLPTSEKELHEVFKTMTLPLAAEYLHKAYLPQVPTSQICQEIEEMGRLEYERRVPVKEGVPEALQKFAEAGVNMCVASASEASHVETALSRLGIRKFFSFTRTCTEAGAGKDKPDLFCQCAQLLGAQSNRDVIVFDDASHALKTAKNAGFRTAGVYDDSFAQEAPFLRRFCDYYFSTAWEWPQLLS